jgi:hypothetical protein
MTSRKLKVPVTGPSDREVMKDFVNLPLPVNAARNLTTAGFIFWLGQLPEKNATPLQFQTCGY